jgi:hypothetical protein
MKVRAVCLGLAMMWGGSVAWADVFRCTGADGKTVYQQSPCATGAQKTVDDSNSRYEARQRQIREAQKREQSGELEKHAKLLRACLEDKICEADSYPLFLRGKPRSFVTDNLGEPASVQNIGGREIHYFNVPTTDGRKRARLQVSYERATAPDSALGVVYGGFVVQSVNVY